SINQNLYINATYNALVDGGKTLIQLPNANQLYIDNDLDRELGIEFGYGISVEVIDRLQIGVNYDFNWHADYTSHAGTLSMRYAF
ncbi:MAG: hypothetical protein R8M71_03790, partial [Alphaproteobacteria bacterium]|nr:hypothetical protein [Alphaproteobacteria bacterium]